MRKEYDLSKMKWIRNPYVKFLKRPITIRIDQDVVQYFKNLSEEIDLPYQKIMNNAEHYNLTFMHYINTIKCNLYFEK